MDFTTFVRKPFVVEAVEITEDNIEEIATYVGTIMKKEDGSPYIQVDRRLIPNILTVYPGFWLTRMGGNTRCYSPRVFNEQFVEMDNYKKELVEGLNGEGSTSVPTQA